MEKGGERRGVYLDEVFRFLMRVVLDVLEESKELRLILLEVLRMILLLFVLFFNRLYVC